MVIFEFYKRISTLSPPIYFAKFNCRLQRHHIPAVIIHHQSLRPMKLIVNRLKTASIVLLLFLLTLAAVAQSTSDLNSLTQIRSGVRSKRISSFDKTGGNNDRIEHIKPGEKKVIFDVKGAGIINHIWITIAPEPNVLHRNDIILRMYWDGNTFPSVESPIGPFFGQGWNEEYPFLSQPLAAAPNGAKALVCYFQMPFAKGARIEIENQNDRDIDAFYYYVDYYEMDKLPADAGRFHAWYNRQVTDTDPTEGENEWALLGPQKPNLKGERNYTIADVSGKGQFVGVNYYVNSPSPMWYGEGDDMIFIDGSAAPSLNGTGTEDYFNTSWSPKEVFMHPYFGYPRVNTTDKSFEMGWMGRTHVYRFNIVDPIYFDKSLRFTIEHGHNNALILELSSVAYWYQSEAGKLPTMKTKEERKPLSVMNPVQLHRWREAWRRSKDNGVQLWGNEN